MQFQTKLQHFYKSDDNNLIWTQLLIPHGFRKIRNVIHNLQLLYMESRVDDLSVFSPFLTLVVYYSHCKQSDKWIWFRPLKVSYPSENIFNLFGASNVYTGCWASPCKRILACICLRRLEENPIFLAKYYIYNIFTINIK